MYRLGSPGHTDSRERQDRLHKLIVVYLDPSIAISVESTECLAQLLDCDTSTDETVEGDSGGRHTTSTRHA